ncbi:hypothetical protein K1T71_000736 [Dendrolimus kikuchii]|uniref:Uncharacterized protein n=1 Tax=Dendrolimus kikuchii TaxID=765133 RepID=A0ACC1DK23_9NEOP|nr:hypothetical protein K1T71_000736 [Dendrolimus kikuchii]
MTVEEVAGLPTCKYSERVQSLKLKEEDLAFLKGLRRRIKNRLASQNSRRRSVEHLRRLRRELRAVRACRDDALSDRRALILQRDTARRHCAELHRHVTRILKERSDSTQVPSIDINIKESQPKDHPKPETIENRIKDNINQNGIFECRIDKLVQQSVNHIFKEKDIDKNRIFAKTVFLTDKVDSEVSSMVFENDIFLPESVEEECGVLNLSVKEGRRKSHGRKQSAPRRIKTYVFHESDVIIDIHIKNDLLQVLFIFNQNYTFIKN